MHHLWSSLCFMIKSKLTVYLEMKTSSPDLAQEGLATAQHRRKRSGISSEKPPSAGQQWNFTSQTHYKIKLIFLQLGKM